MRTYDSLGRYGGDEFLAVLPGCDPTGAARFAESFRARIDRKAIDTPDGLIPVALTLGVAAVEDLLNARPEALVRAADAALYRAKIEGRNRVALATPEDIAEEVSKQSVQEDKDNPDDLFPDLPSSPPPL
jgi:diguanylate cyclase (GGDEF)-like protein